MSSSEFHIIGGGIAGLTAAFALADGKRKIHLWEKENLPCMFSSSKNAAIFRTYESDPTLSILVKESYSQFLQLEKTGGTLLDRRGLIIDPLELDYYEDSYLKNRPELTGLNSVKQSFHLPDGLNFSGLFLRDNGIVDIHAFQNHLMQSALKQGVLFHYNREISLDIENGIIKSLDASGEKFILSADTIIINAAGSWAADLLKTNHAWAPPIAPYKRHLFFIRSKDKISTPANNTFTWPVLWNEKRDVYLRPEGDGFLATHCDQRETSAGDYASDEKEYHRFLPSVLAVFPFLKDYYIARYWACLRTFSLDQHPVVGFDPFIKNLFWVAGLGGRGITMAAGFIPFLREQFGSKKLQNPFAPQRFV